jgi:hypothetical protein
MVLLLKMQLLLGSVKDNKVLRSIISATFGKATFFQVMENTILLMCYIIFIFKIGVVNGTLCGTLINLNFIRTTENERECIHLTLDTRGLCTRNMKIFYAKIWKRHTLRSPRPISYMSQLTITP